MEELFAGREESLKENLNSAFSLLSDLEKNQILLQDPIQKAKTKKDVEELQQKIKGYYGELEELHEQRKKLGIGNAASTTNLATMTQQVENNVTSFTIRRPPYQGCRLYYSGPGDQYALIASLNNDNKPNDIVSLRNSMLDILPKAGFSIVRDRNLPDFPRPFDPGKVRYLISTSDGFCCFCYPKTLNEDTGAYTTSPFILEEIKYALALDLSYIVAFVEETVKDPALEEILKQHTGRIQRYKVAASILKDPKILAEKLISPWEAIQPGDHNIFVTIPFEQKYDPVFEVIREVVREVCNLECYRSKDTALGTASEEVEVYRAVINKIEQSPFVIMVLAENRPNCYFEAGVAAAFNRPAIRLIGEKDNIPFNIQHWPLVITSLDPLNTEELRQNLRRELSRFAREEMPSFSRDR
jgi:hypothetical protein